MALYTFVADYQGGTYIRQIEANALKQACIYWADQTSLYEDIPGLDEAEFRAEFQDDMREFSPTALDETHNVWYMSFLVSGDLISVNVIKTDMAKEPVFEDAYNMAGNPR